MDPTISCRPRPWRQVNTNTAAEQAGLQDRMKRVPVNAKSRLGSAGQFPSRKDKVSTKSAVAIPTTKPVTFSRLRRLSAAGIRLCHSRPGVPGDG